MKILFIGDPHIRVENFVAIDRLVEVVQNQCSDVNLIVVAGDVLHYHERLHTLALNKAIDFLTSLGKLARVVCLVGNHDMINNQQFLSHNHWMHHYKDKIPNVDIVECPLSYEMEGARFVCVPYVFPGRFVEALESTQCHVGDKFHWSESDIIFAHQEFKGCRMGAIVSDDGDEWNPEWPQVISGHIHDYQKPQSNVFYPGTPMQHSFGDKGGNIVLRVDINDGNVHFEEIVTDVEKKKTIYTSVEDVASAFAALNTESDTQIKFAIKGTAEEFKVFKDSKEYKDLVQAGIKVTLKQESKVRPEETDDHGNLVFSDMNDFETILHDLLKKVDNPQVMRDYRSVFHTSIFIL